VAQRFLPAVMDAKSISNPAIYLLFSVLSPPPARSSPGSFAYHRYESIVSLPTLIAYVALSGIAVLACCIAQVVSRLSTDPTSGSSRIPRLSRFPTLDLFAHCTIEDENRCVIYQGRSGFFPANKSQRSLRSWLSTVSIKWSRSLSVEDGLPLFALDFIHEQDDNSSANMSSLFQYSSRSKISLFRSRD
jgi:hypothetical protein